MIITVYTTGPDCIRCMATKKLFDLRGIPYREINIRDDKMAHDYVVTHLGYTQAQVVVVDNGDIQNHWSGVRPDLIDRISPRP